MLKIRFIGPNLGQKLRCQEAEIIRLLGTPIWFLLQPFGHPPPFLELIAATQLYMVF